MRRVYERDFRPVSYTHLDVYKRQVQVICDGYDDENDLYICRTRADAPDIDAECCVRSETPLEPLSLIHI